MAKADWNRWDFSRRLKVDNLSRERICAGSNFQDDGVKTENAREGKLVVMLEGLARRCVFEELRLWVEGGG